jgi:DNA helicase-2/ATP-dependent DNA helicase PcrA
MDTTRLLQSLNTAQQEAVNQPEIPVLVLAGAGSGKTRVLVHRVAWRLAIDGCRPDQVLAVTFTNKAAREMRERIFQLAGPKARSMWLGTFHSIGYRILVRHAAQAGLTADFTILDDEDQRRLVRQLIRDRQWDERNHAPSLVQWYINQQKDAGRRAGQVAESGGEGDEALRLLYTDYEKKLKTLGATDFPELLFGCLELWRAHPRIRDQYRERFAEILIDEFQDTNPLQYLWFRELTGPGARPFVVGDDDQAIYGWRGARIEHILAFSRDFPQSRTIRLEQNYRSSRSILQAANALISHNPSRLGKTLWTEGEQGRRPVLFTADHEQEEADYIVTEIERQLATGLAASTIAVLYRSNSQSRVIEEGLVRHRIPYRVYGGVRFLERAEIKDVLSYLRLLVNPDHTSALERALHAPPRGIGDKTLERARELAQTESRSLNVALSRLAQDATLASRTRSALGQWFSLLSRMQEAIAGQDLPQQVERVIELSGLPEFYRQEDPLRAESRLESLGELINAAATFEPEEVPDGESPLSRLAAFLAQMTLATDLESGETRPAEVQLMSLHAAKGLEFHTVFISGLEEGLVPHIRSLDTAGGLEEERRLFYVGMTRAQEQLFLTVARQRRLRGRLYQSLPSRFLREIPESHLDVLNPSVRTLTPAWGMKPASPPRSRLPEAGQPVSIGRRVRHPRFGEGVVLDHEGTGAQCRVQVRFDQAGSKWLIWSMAHLENLDS